MAWATHVFRRAAVDQREGRDAISHLGGLQRRQTGNGLAAGLKTSKHGSCSSAHESCLRCREQSTQARNQQNVGPCFWKTMCREVQTCEARPNRIRTVSSGHRMSPLVDLRGVQAVRAGAPLVMPHRPGACDAAVSKAGRGARLLPARWRITHHSRGRYRRRPSST